MEKPQLVFGVFANGYLIELRSSAQSAFELIETRRTKDLQDEDGYGPTYKIEVLEVKS